MQDIIKREIRLKADPKKIYEAITNPDQIIKWFPDGVEGSMEVGKQAIFNFEGHGKSSVYIVAATPYEYFAYRWIPGGANIVDDLLSVTTTLIEFHIENLGTESKVTLTESGFSSLPADVAEESFKQNSGGWDYMIDRLQKLIG